MTDKVQRLENHLWLTKSQKRILELLTADRGNFSDLVRTWLDKDAESDLNNPDLAELLPSVYYKLVQHNLIDDVQTFACTSILKAKYQARLALTIQQSQHWEFLLRQLKNANVSPILIKGSSLLHGYYSSPVERVMSDMDILVSEADRSTAINTITEHGWQKIDSPVETQDSGLSHAVPFDKPSAYLSSVDLHSHVLANCFIDKLDDWFFDNTEACEYAGVSVRRLNPTALLTHTLLHGVKCDLSGPTRWVRDANAIVSERGEEIDWHNMINFAERFDLLYRIKLGLHYLEAQEYLSLPQDISLRLQSHTPGWLEKFECAYLFKDKEYDPDSANNSYGLLAQHILYCALRMDRITRLPISLFRVCKYHIAGDSLFGVVRRLVFYKTP